MVGRLGAERHDEHEAEEDDGEDDEEATLSLRGGRLLAVGRENVGRDWRNEETFYHKVERK